MDSATAVFGTENLIESFMERKEQRNVRANKYRDLRDAKNDETKRWAQKRDELNAKVRGLIDEANRHKAKRDELNGQVKEGKLRRDELNKAANEKAEALNSVKKERTPRDGLSVGKLKHQLRLLEFEQQTKVLTPKKEKDLVDQIAALQRQIEQKEKEYALDSTVKDAYEAMKGAKVAAEDAHRVVTQAATAAQAEHDAMVKLFEEADKVRKEADGAQEKFIASKTDADKIHHEYIDLVNQIRDFDKVGGAMRQKERKSRQEAGHATAKAEAEDIFDKFKKGEKLSTEDLMALQKAGLL
ncbi:MAG: coiled-coil protein [Thermoplasmatota archaeon]